MAVVVKCPPREKKRVIEKREVYKRNPEVMGCGGWSFVQEVQTTLSAVK
jgi:hypothetical protein